MFQRVGFVPTENRQTAVLFFDAIPEAMYTVYVYFRMCDRACCIRNSMCS